MAPHGQVLGDVDISTLSDPPARCPRSGRGVMLGADRRPCRRHYVRGDQV